MKYDIIIIGGGPGGYVAGIRASQLGKKVAIIERENLGGICLNWGCIPTKALLKSAQVYNYIKGSESYGIEVECEAKPDMTKIVARSRGVASNMNKGVIHLMKKNDIDVIEGVGRINSNKEVEVELISSKEKQTYKADHIILATGARSRELPNLPQDGKDIIGYRQAMTLDHIPESMVVVGSGAIGSEFAYLYQSLGTEVHLVEFMPKIVPNEDDEVSSTLSRAFRKMGMKVKTSTSVEKVEREGGKLMVTLKGKKKEEIIETDIVLSAVGVTPNIENLGLEELGVELEGNKIKVDEFYKTNVPGIYAIGDIVHGPALAHVSSKEALVCVEAILGENPKPIKYDNIPGCTYTLPEIASVGITEARAKEEGLDVKIGKFMFMASGKASASGVRDGFVKVIINSNTDELLGCHMIGDNVTEMIEEAVLARQSGIKANDIADAIHPHPTMSEGVMEAIQAACSKAIHG